MHACREVLRFGPLPVCVWHLDGRPRRSMGAMALNYSPVAPAIRPVAPDDRRCTRAAGRPTRRLSLIAGDHRMRLIMARVIEIARDPLNACLVNDFCAVAMQVRESSCMTSTPLESKQSLAPGDRVRMSEFGLARHPKYGDRQGLIVGRGSASGWRVKFDERRSIQTIHQEYLEKVERSVVSSGRSDVKDIS
jgi:hypothetical protein